jgi:hypothetical protein
LKSQTPAATRNCQSIDNGPQRADINKAPAHGADMQEEFAAFMQVNRPPQHVQVIDGSTPGRTWKNLIDRRPLVVVFEKGTAGRTVEGHGFKPCRPGSQRPGFSP